MNRKQRAAVIRQLQAALGGDRGLAEHVHDMQMAHRDAPGGPHA